MLASCFFANKTSLGPSRPSKTTHRWQRYSSFRRNLFRGWSACVCTTCMATLKFTRQSPLITAICDAACSLSQSWDLCLKLCSKTTFSSTYPLVSSLPSLTSIPRHTRLRAVTQIFKPNPILEARQQSLPARTTATTKRTRPYSIRAKWPAIPTSFMPSCSLRSV